MLPTALLRGTPHVPWSIGTSWQRTSMSSSAWPRKAGKRSAADSRLCRQPNSICEPDQAAIGRLYYRSRSGSHFLALKDDVADDEHAYHAGNHADHLRPGNDNA